MHMETSTKQLEANRRNALLSTGPRTPAGKASSSGNSLRHGLLSARVLIEGEDLDEFEAFGAEIRDKLQPEGPLEQELVERIIVSAWRLWRIAAIEAGILGWQGHRRAAQLARKEAVDIEYLSRADAPLSERSCRMKDRPYHQACEREMEAANNLRSGVVALGRSFADEIASMSVLARYETTIDRALYRALHELQRLQAARTGERVPMPVAVDINISD